MTRDQLKTRTQQAINAIRVFKEKDYGWSEMEKMLYEILLELDDSDWQTGTPTDVGWFLIKYECVCEGRYKGTIGYRAVRRKKDPIDGYIYEDGAIKADDVWKPIEWQKIESFKEENNGFID